MVEMTSSAMDPPSPTHLRDSCMDLEMNLFMRPKVIEIMGMMEDMASASLHCLITARTKPVTKAATKRVAKGTFSDIPRWKRSKSTKLKTKECQDAREVPACVCLDPGSDLTRTNIIEKGDILAENRGEVL